MLINENVELDFDDVLLLPNRSKAASRKDVELNREFKFYHSPRVWSGTPIFASNMANIGTFEMSIELAKHKFCTALHKFYKSEELIDFFNSNKNLYDYIWYTTGIREEDTIKLKSVFSNLDTIPNIVIDVPNGYTDTFVNHCSYIRNLYPDSIIMAGNVCTSNMVQELILHGGVDIVKCGNSYGGACRTKNKTGIGRPMISTIIDCANVANGLNSGDGKLGLICSDGGCKQVGDICKGLAAGASFIMLGSLLSGYEENSGEWELEYQTCHGEWKSLSQGQEKPITRKKCLKFYGMSSHYAQEKHYNQIRSYATSEGDIITIPYKGKVENIIFDILGGIRSCCSYLGIKNIEYMSRAANFIRLK